MKLRPHISAQSMKRENRKRALSILETGVCVFVFDRLKTECLSYKETNL